MLVQLQISWIRQPRPQASMDHGGESRTWREEQISDTAGLTHFVLLFPDGALNPTQTITIPSCPHPLSSLDNGVQCAQWTPCPPLVLLTLTVSHSSLPSSAGLY